jgi:thioredoxin reductase (NADPH)
MGLERQMNKMKGTIQIYGTTWCQDCKRAKHFLGEHRIPYRFIDINGDREGFRLAEQVNGGKHSVPMIFFPDGSVLAEPSKGELAAKLGLQIRPGCPFYDLVVVGGGPAGLTASLYAAWEGIDTLVIEPSGFGGQAGITDRLNNYPGFPDGIDGNAFVDRLVAQCQRFGVELLSASVTSLASDGQYRAVRLADGQVRAHAVLLAPGSTYRYLGVPGEAALIGAGIHFCATCDGPFYRGQEVLVIGGGNSATEEAIFLTQFARRITIVMHRSQLMASQVAKEKVLAHPQIDVRYRTVVTAFHGNGKLRGVTLKELTTSNEKKIHPAGVFVFIGLQPNTGFLNDVVALNEWGFIVTAPTLETSLVGVFAAGDARAGSTKQVVSAASEGATAALMIRQYLQAVREVPSTEVVERDTMQGVR